MISSHRWWISFPFISALGVLIFLGWSMTQVWVYPHDGIVSIHPTAAIRQNDPSSSTAKHLRNGDVIISIENIPLADAKPFYAGKHAGEDVTLLIERDGNTFPVTIRLEKPTADELMNRIAPFGVAIIFWLIGVGLQTFKPVSESTKIYFVFFQVSALILITGVTSYPGPPWVSSLYSFLLWIISPVIVHFHLHFPQRTTTPSWRKIINLLYLAGFFGGLPYLVSGTQSVQNNSWYSDFVFASRIFLAINFLIVFLLLVYSYRNATTSGARSKIRIVLLGGGVSLLPIVTLIILPDAIFKQTIVPSAFLFIFLGILPLTYGYAIFRYRLIEIERHVNRGATIILVYSILGAFYLILYGFLTAVLPAEWEQIPIINTLLVLILATVFVPLYRRVQRMVDTMAWDRSTTCILWLM